MDGCTSHRATSTVRLLIGLLDRILMCVDLHDLFMIVYLILNLPWMILSTMHSTNERSKRWRMVCASGFLATLAPLIYWFYQHSVLRVPGGESLRRKLVLIVKQRTHTTPFLNGPLSSGTSPLTLPPSSNLAVCRFASLTHRAPRTARRGGCHSTVDGWGVISSRH